MKRFSTGHKLFDEILDGGIVEGSSLLVVGDYGVGKTTLLRKLQGNCEVLYGHQRPSKGKDIYIIEEIHSPAQALQDLKNFEETDKTRVFVCLPKHFERCTPAFDAVVQIKLEPDSVSRKLVCLKNRFGAMKKTTARFRISDGKISWLKE